jgi:RNA polymerase sigma factor for flagellar operon FliA
MTNVISLNEFVEQGTEPAMETERNSHFIQPEEKIAKDELKEKLKAALDVLTEKEKQVILLYYYEEMTLKEISQILSVSESRVSQLHTKALGKMRSVMGDYLGILTGGL